MKKRSTFTLSENAIKKLAEITNLENRSMSSMVEQLILIEAEKTKRIGAKQK